jgi:PAS domain S-box-containing protein
MNKQKGSSNSQNVSQGDMGTQGRLKEAKAKSHKQEDVVAALKESEERYDALFSRQLEAVYICDFDGNFIDANPAALDMLGYTKEEISLLDFESLLTPDQLPKAFKTLSEIFETGSHKELKEYELRHKDGHFINIETKGSLIYREGEPYAIQGTARDITERKRIEEEIKEQNRFLTNVLESLSHPFYVVNANDYTVESANTTAKRAGISEGVKCHAASHGSPVPCKSEGQPCPLEEVKKTREPAICEHEHIDSKGNKNYVEVHAYPIFDSQGEVDKVIEYTLDITDRKKTVESLIHERDLMQTFFDNHTDFIYFKDAEARFYRVSKRFCDFFELNMEDIIGKTDLELFPEEIAQQTYDEDLHVIKTGTPIINKEENSQGTWVLTTKLPWFDEQGNVKGLFGISRDITERKKGEMAIKQSEDKFRKFFENEPEYCYMLSPEGVILDVNKSALNALGYEKDELMGKPIKTIYAPECHPDMKELFKKWKENGNLKNEEMTIKSKSGERRHVLLSSESIMDESGNLLYSVSVQRDITERMKVQEALQYRLAYEELLANISAHFINLKSEEIDDGINGALKSIGNFVGVDRIYIFLLSEDRTKMSNTHEWCKVGIESQMDDLQDLEVETFSWGMEQLRNLRILNIPCVADMPEEANNDKKILQVGGIQSLISVPIIIGDSLYGFIGFDSVLKEMDWSNDIISLIKMTAEIFANALERTRSDVILRESEEKYRLLFENSLEGISITKGKTTISANKALLDIYGYESFEEYSAVPIFDRLALESRKSAIERFKAIENGEFVPPRSEYQILRKDGEIRDIHVSTTEMLIGNEKYVQATVRDITEHKKTEEIIKESESKYRGIVEQSTYGVVIAQGEQAKLAFVNETFAKNLGYTSEEVLSFSPEEVMGMVHPEDREFFFKRYHDRLSGKVVISRYEVRGIHKDKSVRWFDITSNRVILKGEPAVQATFIDITDRKYAEEALKASEENYRAIFESVNDAIMIHDARTGRPLDINPKMEELLGYDMGELAQLKIGDWSVGDPDIMQEKAMEKIMEAAAGKPQLFEWHIKRKESTKIWAEVNLRSAVITGQECVLAVVRDITERKKSEATLKESEEKFRSIIEQSSEGIMLMDEEGTITEWNNSMEELTGIPRAEAVDNPIWEVQYRTSPEPQDDRRPIEDFKLQIVKYFSTIEKTQDQNGRDQKIVTLDGETKYIQYSAFPIVTEKGRMICGISKDITERKKAEEAIRESEEKYRDLVENINDVIYKINTDGTVTYVSPTIESYIGYTPSEIMGQSFRDFIYEEDLPRLINNIQAIFSGNISDNEYRILTKSGDIRWIHTSSKPVIIDNQVTGLHGVLSDITERKKSEEALRESEEKFRTLFELSPYSTIFSDLQGNILACNNQFTKLYNTKQGPENQVGRNVSEFFPKEELPLLFSTVEKTIKDEKSQGPVEFMMQKEDGTKFTAEADSNLIKNAKGEPFALIAIVKDITDRKKAEQALLESEKRLLTAQHIAHLGFWEWDLKTSELYWSDEAYRIMGYEPQEFKPTYDDFLSLIHSEDKSSFSEAVDNVMHGISELKIDHRLKIKDEKEVHVNSQGELIRDEKGIPIRMMGTLIDITDRMKAEEAVRLSEEKYRTLFSTSPEAIVLMDLNGTIIDCNEAASKIGELAKGQMIGKLFTDLGIIDEKGLPEIIDLFQRILDTNEFKPIELEINLAGQEKWIETYPSILKKNNEPYALHLIIRDITERKHADQEISQRNEELSTLNTISGTINQTLELKEVLNVALEETISVLNVEGGMIFLSDTENKKFTPAIYYGFSEESIPEFTGFQMGEGVSGQAAKLGIPLFVPNLEEDAKHISSAFFKDGWESLVSVPLKSKGSVVGVMTISSRRKGQFRPEDIGLLRAIGNQIGVAIENARLYGISQDELAERRRVERKISEQNKFLKNVLESLTHPFYVVNMNNNLIEIANSAARTRGITVGASCYESTHDAEGPCGLTDQICPIGEIKKTKNPVTVEHIHHDGDGNLRNTEIHAYPIFNDTGDVERMIEYAVDITDRKRAESELRDRDAQLRSVVTSSPIVLWALNSDGIFTLSEGKALEALGQKPGQLVGQSLFDVYKDTPQILDENKRALNGEEFSSSLKFADLIWETFYSPLKDQRGDIVGSIGVATDITKRMKAESEREILFRELKHRVKNNLQLLSSMVDMQIMRSDDPKIKNKLQEIQSVIDTIALIYSRAYEGTEIAGLNLNIFIEELLGGLMKFKANDDLIIQHTISGDSIRLSTDSAIPMALIANELVFNALKHAFNGRKMGKLSISLKEEKDTITMSIADDGVGLREDVDLNKPDSFGLKIVNNLIKQLNGTMETKVKDGTEFILKIPKENNGE